MGYYDHSMANKVENRSLHRPRLIYRRLSQSDLFDAMFIFVARPQQYRLPLPKSPSKRDTSADDDRSQHNLSIVLTLEAQIL